MTINKDCLSLTFKRFKNKLGRYPTIEEAKKLVDMCALEEKRKLEEEAVFKDVFKLICSQGNLEVNDNHQDLSLLLVDK
ncbi:MAG: hypothetical protein RR228_02370 [Bacilli bacterium]